MNTTNPVALKSAVRAIAQITRINLAVALETKRYNPILERETHIDEELVNLKESMQTVLAAGDTLHNYPQMYYHVMREKRAIARHCLGLVIRMIRGNKLPWKYTEEDTQHAVAALVRLVIEEAYHTDTEIDPQVMEALRPFLSLRQRLLFRAGVDFSTVPERWHELYAQTVRTMKRPVENGKDSVLNMKKFFQS